jgi:hypothetical protein
MRVAFSMTVAPLALMTHMAAAQPTPTPTPSSLDFHSDFHKKLRLRADGQVMTFTSIAGLSRSVLKMRVGMAG